MEKKKLLKSLMTIQQNLKAPKNKKNTFGGYNYRSLEDIEEALKPHLLEEGCGIRFNDEIEDHCGRTFLKTTLHLFNEEEEITTTAIAEQEPTKKGMDAAQISGAASSYARKYAMNAMFAIDDTKDPDTDEFKKQQEASKKEQEQKQQAQQQPKYDGAQIKRLLAEFGTETNLQGVFTIFDKAASIGASRDNTVLEELKKTFVRVISHNVSSGAASFADIEAYFTQKNWGAYFNGIKEDINKAIQEKGGAA